MNQQVNYAQMYYGNGNYSGNVDGHSAYLNAIKSANNAVGGEVKSKNEMEAITVKNFAEFPSTLEGAITTNYDIARKVFSILKIALPGTVGVIVSVDPRNGFINTSIFIAPIQGENPMVKDIVGGFRNNNIAERMSAMGARSANRTLELTNSAKERLLPFMMHQNGKVNWDQCAVEVVDRVNYNQSRALIRVNNINVLEIIKNLIYGARSDNDAFEYNLSVIRPMNSGMTYTSPEQVQYIMSIQRLSLNSMDELARKCGLIGSTNGIFMVNE